MEDLENARKYFVMKGVTPIEVDLNELVDVKVDDTKLLIIPNGVRYLVDTDELLKEVDDTPKDSKATGGS